MQTGSGKLDASAHHASAGHVNVETMRGSPGLHGQGSLFNRQNFWGAQNPFTQWAKEIAPGSLSAVPVFTPEPYTPSDRETTWDLGSAVRFETTNFSGLPRSTAINEMIRAYRW